VARNSGDAVRGSLAARLRPLSSEVCRERDDVFVFTVVFWAGALGVAAFFVVLVFAGAFLAGAVFAAVCFAGAFFAAVFFAVAFPPAVLVLSVVLLLPVLRPV
jgi:hypothetical protein